MLLWVLSVQHGQARSGSYKFFCFHWPFAHPTLRKLSDDIRTRSCFITSPGLNCLIPVIRKENKGLVRKSIEINSEHLPDLPLTVFDPRDTVKEGRHYEIILGNCNTYGQTQAFPSVCYTEKGKMIIKGHYIAIIISRSYVEMEKIEFEQFINKFDKALSGDLEPQLYELGLVLHSSFLFPEYLDCKILIKLFLQTVENFLGILAFFYIFFTTRHHSAPAFAKSDCSSISAFFFSSSLSTAFAAPSIIASGRGGQPCTYTSTGITLSTGPTRL